MINPFKEVNWSPDLKECRKFAVSFMVGWPIIALLFLFFIKYDSGQWNFKLPIYIIVIGFFSGLIFYVAPILTPLFYKIWYFVTCCIGFVIGNILFASLFYFMFTFIGLTMRFFRRDPLRRGRKKQTITNWTEIEENSDLRRYYRQF